MKKLMFCTLFALSTLTGCGAALEGDLQLDESEITEEARRRSCATVRCAAGTHCELRPVQCVRAPCPPVPVCVPNAPPPPSCATVRCAAGTHCELRPVQCVRAPCPPQPTCVPDPVDPCATVRCAAGTHCVAENGRATCEPDLTCAAVLCITGTTCVMRDGRPVCEPVAGACSRDSDCRLSDNYCGGCACDALGPGQRPATCSNPVQCFRQPCQGMSARCNPDTRRCEAVRATAGAACGRTTCPSGQVCCNASCGICTPPGGACIQLACQ